MIFGELAKYLDRLEKISSRLEITKILSELFKHSSSSEIDKVVYLSLGILAPNYKGVILNLAEKMMIRVLAKAYVRDEGKVKSEYKRAGDIGDVAQVLSKKHGSDVSVNDVYKKLLIITQDTGVGSQEGKVEKMAGLLKSLDPLSARFVARIPMGRLRLGFSEKTVIDALASASGIDSGEIEGAYNIRPDIGYVARLVKEKNLKKASPEVGVPVVPMLCQRLNSPVEMVKKMGEVAAVLTRGVIDVGGRHPERVARKRLLINGVAKRLIDFSGNFKVVLFGPWDLDLVTESPSLRRKFLDTVLSQADREYRRSVLSYEKGLRQRNKLLYRIREEGVGRSQLLFWNQLLIKNGNYLTDKRQEFIEFINSQPGLNKQQFELEYDRSAISEGRLEQYAEEEVAAATTLVGPHRDDFTFQISGPKAGIRNLDAYGSRGEQRMGVLWLKIAELNFDEQRMGQRPTLLLDDIFSELDHEHREVVMDLAKHQQTIITTTDEHFIRGLRANDIIKL